MFKRFSIAIAAILSMSPVAKASMLEDYIYSNPVLEAVHSSGTRILFKDPSCDGSLYGSYNSKTDVMVLCIATHPDLEELGDTIRHETIHIIQTCNGGPILSLAKLFEFAKPVDYQFISNYPNIKQHIELEAHIGARSMTDTQVATHFTNACLS